MEYTIRTDVTLDRTLDETFAFFADAGNLEAITPPELRFSIRTPLPIEMKRGALIEYQLSLYGIPFSWLTEISVWEPGVRFVDQQVRGPFAKWVHEHTFEALPDGRTRIRDEVQYALPLGTLGRIAHPLVRSKLDRIFSFREESVLERLSPAPEAPAPEAPAPEAPTRAQSARPSPVAPSSPATPPAPKERAPA